jgi:phosphate transport system substrate-binding protein
VARRPLWAAFLLAWALLAACRQPPPPPPTVSPAAPVTLRLGVSEGAAPFAALVTAVYPTIAPDVDLRFIAGNNAALRDDLAAGALDAILVYHLPPETALWFNPVAVDGLVLVVPPAHPVRELSREEARAIFNGRLTAWSAVGGPEQPIVLLSREAGADAFLLFERRLMGAQRIAVTAQVVPGDAALRQATAAEPGAIGYTFMAAAAEVRPLTLDGVPPTPATVAAQSYPLTTPLYVAALAEPTGPLRAWIAWAQSEAGQTVIGERYGRVR